MRIRLMSSRNGTLCFILTDRPPRRYWAGRGRLVPLSQLCLSGLPQWPDRQGALRAASALARVLSLELHPMPLRLP